MGEIIKILVKKSDGFKFEIELNKGNNINDPRMIHIQNESGRIQFTEKDFISICATLIEGINNFKINKNLNDKV